MYCWKCGSFVAVDHSFCNTCGIPVHRLTSTWIHPQPRSFSYPGKTLQRRSMIRLGIGIACVITAIFFLTPRQRQTNSSRTQEEAVARESTLQEEAKREQAKFDSMLPAQHLAEAKSDLQVDADNERIWNGKKHVAALQGTPLQAQGTALERQYHAEQDRADKARAKAADAEAAQQRRRNAAAAEDDRRAFAKDFENALLAEGYDVDVDAIGPLHTTLRLKYVLATKVYVYEISNHWQTQFDQMRGRGFKKFAVDNGDQYWSWTLSQ